MNAWAAYRCAVDAQAPWEHRTQCFQEGESAGSPGAVPPPAVDPGDASERYSGDSRDRLWRWRDALRPSQLAVAAILESHWYETTKQKRPDEEGEEGRRKRAERQRNAAYRVSRCGISVIGNFACARRRGKAKARYVNVLRCGNVWRCPVCSADIRARRAREVEKAVDWAAQAEGGSALMLTLTVAHHWGDDLSRLRRGVAAAFRRFVQGRPWQSFEEDVGVLGFVRALEVTHGKNGWHPHLHILLLVRDEKTLRARADWISERWIASVVRILGEDARPSMERGANISKPRTVAEYLTKLGLDSDEKLALELTDPWARKRARNGKRSPWEIALDAADELRLPDGERRASLKLWAEWVAGMAGAKCLTWSRGLRDAAGIGPEVDDEQDGDAEDPTETVVEVRIPSPWFRALDYRPGGRLELLKVLEAQGASGLRATLRRWLVFGTPRQRELWQNGLLWLDDAEVAEWLVDEDEDEEREAIRAA